MKTAILLSLMLFSSGGRILAQDPFCAYKPLPYKFCDRNGKRIIKCSTDPHRELGLIPERGPEPPCMIPAQTYPNIIEMSASPGPQIIKVFDPYEAILDLNYAFEQWAKLCPNTQGSPTNGYCCIKIFMSDNQFDFADPILDFDRMPTYYITNRECRADCSQTYDIFINFTKKFLWENLDPASNPVTYAWFTGARSPKNNVDFIHGNVASFRRYMMYDFGRAMGLVDRSGDESTGCDDWTTVMGSPESDQDQDGLTDDDKCQFIKLYCPDQVGLEPALSVEEESTTGLILSQNIPNPFTEMTTISYSLQRAGDVNLRIIDAVGQEVKTLVDQRMEAGSYTAGFRASEDMPAGTYWYVLSVGDVIQAKEMILIR